MRLIKACGSIACDSNHLDGDPEKLCISYGGSNLEVQRWALAGEIDLKGKFRDVPRITFQSAKLAETVCSGTKSVRGTKSINPFVVRKKVIEVLEEYKSNNIKFDLVIWGKCSMKGLLPSHFKKFF